MFWGWQQGRPALCAIDAEDPTIQLHRGSNKLSTIPIRQQNLYKSYQIHGVYQTPMGDFSDHLKALRKQQADQAPVCRISSIPLVDTIRSSNFSQIHLLTGNEIRSTTNAVDEEAGTRKHTNSHHPNQRLGLSSMMPTPTR